MYLGILEKKKRKKEKEQKIIKCWSQAAQHLQHFFKKFAWINSEGAAVHVKVFGWFGWQIFVKL